MKTYTNPTFRRIRDRLLRDGSVEEIHDSVERAEKLFYEVDRARVDSVVELSKSLSGEAGADLGGTTASGEDIRRDLGLFVEDLSHAHPRPAEDMDQAVLSVQDAARRFRVSAKTISRWRRDNLAGRYFLIDGRKCIGFLQSSISRFVENHPRVIERAARFRHLSDDQRQHIVDRYRRLRRAGTRRATAIGRIAGDVECSKETVRNVLKQQSVERVTVLALDYMPSDEFDKPDADSVILGPTPQPARAPKKTRPPAGLAPYLAELYETRLLTSDQERHLFRKFNYLKFKAARLRDELDLSNPTLAALDRIETLFDQSVRVKNELIRANLRLVVSLAKQRVSPTRDFYNLVSDGNISLIRAVERFDYTRGFKFSTYATWAVVKNFARTIPTEAKHQARFQVASDELFKSVEDERVDHMAQEREEARRRHSVNRLLSYLSDREQDIIVRRFGLDYRLEPQTLQQIGDELGVSKERIRQLQSRAIEKLREAAARAEIDLAELN